MLLIFIVTLNKYQLLLLDTEEIPNHPIVDLHEMDGNEENAEYKEDVGEFYEEESQGKCVKYYGEEECEEYYVEEECEEYYQEQR